MADNKKRKGGLIPFMLLIGRLKKEKRTGWVRKGLKEPESISDHMYRMSILAMVLDEGEDMAEPLDRTHCIKMALVHDMAEAIVGDLTPHCGVSKKEKSRRESRAMMDIKELLAGNQYAEEVVNLWQEYEEGATKEAKAVKDLDKLEMILQAYEYEQDQLLDKDQNLQEFFDSVDGKIKHPQIKEWETDLRSLRNSAARDSS